jgi:hypothetical protein
MQKGRKYHSPATRETARFVSDWFDNTTTSSSNRRAESKDVNSDLPKPSTSYQIKASIPQAVAGRAMYFGNDVLLCDRNRDRSKLSGESRESKDVRLSMKGACNLSRNGEVPARRAVMLGRSWSELLSTPPGTVVGPVEERDSQLAVQACRVAGVETSPRTGKRTTHTTGAAKSDSPRSANEISADQNLFMRERELFLKERELFMRERESFLAEKQRFKLEKEKLLRSADKNLREAPAASIAGAVRLHHIHHCTILCGQSVASGIQCATGRWRLAALRPSTRRAA